MRIIGFREIAAAGHHLKHDIVLAMFFIFPHSHAFNGGQLTVEDDGASGSSCLIVFADGTTVIGALIGAFDKGYTIKVPDYKTAKGSTVNARTWHITRRTGESVWRSKRFPFLRDS